MTIEASSLPILLARIDSAQVGFPASAVREILRAVAIASLPGAPDIIEGAINLRGRIVPVVDVRQSLALPASDVSPDQYLITLQTSERLIAVRVDDVEDVIAVQKSNMQTTKSLSPALERLHGVTAIATGALVIYDVDAFLTQAEQEALDLTALVTG
jgi:purine-binding chemotaxis protein CheW